MVLNSHASPIRSTSDGHHLVAVFACSACPQAHIILLVVDLFLKNLHFFVSSEEKPKEC